MEPTIVSTIIWGVIWLVVGPIVGVLIFWGGIALGAFLGSISKKDRLEAGAGLGAVLGWVGAIVWDIFVLIQVILHVVTLIGLIIAGAS